jgi:carbamoyltransferase
LIPEGAKEAIGHGVRAKATPYLQAATSPHLSEWFELDVESPYMLLVADVAERRRRAMTAEEQALFGIDKRKVPRSEIPRGDACRLLSAHPDRSRRDQPALPCPAVGFQAQDGLPVVVNTSFNVRGEPIVRTPEEAFRCFMGTELDV